MLGDPLSGSEVWKALDREIGTPGENRKRLRWALQNKNRWPLKRLTGQSVPNQTVQPLEPLAHVGDSGGQIDPGGWTQAKHGLRSLQRTHQPF